MFVISTHISVGGIWKLMVTSYMFSYTTHKFSKKLSVNSKTLPQNFEALPENIQDIPKQTFANILCSM